MRSLYLTTHRSPHSLARRSVLLLLKINTLACFSWYANELYAISIRRFICLQSDIDGFRLVICNMYRFEFSKRRCYAVFYSFRSKSLGIFVCFYLRADLLYHATVITRNNGNRCLSDDESSFFSPTNHVQIFIYTQVL